MGNIKVGYERWENDNNLGEKFWDHKNTIMIKYEELITDFQLTMSRIFYFLGEDYEDVSNFHKKKRLYYSKNPAKPESPFGRNHGQFRNWQINQPMSDRRGRWKYLSIEERKETHKAIGPKLIKYGYIEDDSWIYYKEDK